MSSNEEVNVRLAGGYPLGQLERLIRDLSPLFEISEPSPVRVDLGGLVHINPAGIALLAATLRRLVELGLAESGILVPPRSSLTWSYLLRMDVVAEGMVIDYEEPFERHEPVGFRPCQHFEGADCHRSAAELATALAEQCETDSRARASLLICLDELAENVVHHAESPVGGFAAAQGWPRRRREVEVAIVDLGRGIRASLTNNPAYADIRDDVTAIQTALEPNVSATPERNSGLGLSVTKLLLHANGGSLLVRSGEGAVYSGSREEAGTRDHKLPGTLVAVTARTDQPLDIRAVWRDLGLSLDDD